MVIREPAARASFTIFSTRLYRYFLCNFIYSFYVFLTFWEESIDFMKIFQAKIFTRVLSDVSWPLELEKTRNKINLQKSGTSRSTLFYRYFKISQLYWKFSKTILIKMGISRLNWCNGAVCSVFTIKARYSIPG